MKEHDGELYDEVQRRALFELPEEEPEAPVDLVHTLREGDLQPAGEARDATLAGYFAMHDRPPAFEGSDGQPYTVDIDMEATNDPDRPFAAFFVFIRWAATGAGIMDHVETDNVAYGPTEETAREAAMELSLYEIKAELDAAIERKRNDLEG